MTDILFQLSAFVASAAGTVAGFGTSTILLPLAALAFPFRDALLLAACAHVVSALGRVSLFRSGLDRGLLARFGIPSVLCGIAGAMLVPLVPQRALSAGLGAFIVAYAALALGGAEARLRPTPSAAVAGGVLSGFLAGIIGTGGALRGAFLSAFRLPKDAYIATAAVIAVATDLTRIPVYLAQGVGRDVWPHLPILAAMSLGGAWAGHRVVRRLPQAAFRAVVLVALLLAGAKLLGDGLAS